MNHSSERIHGLDFIRGIAVLGIFVMNMESFSYPAPFKPAAYGFETSLDHEVRFWVYWLFQGKFFGIFALLFAVGFDIFLGNLEKRGLGLQSMDVYGRRLLWLFVIGVVHCIFLWTGDILHHYAICGLLLIPFRSFSQKGILFSILALSLVLFYNDYQRVDSRQSKFEDFQEAIAVTSVDRSAEQNKSIESWERVTSQPEQESYDDDNPRLGDYWSNFDENLEHVGFNSGKIFYSGILIRTLILMLAGVWLWRMQVFQDYQSVKGYWLWTLVVISVGLLINYLRSAHWTFYSHEPILSYWRAWTETLAKEILAVGYVLLLNGFYQKLNQPLTILNKVGKMALSVYIFQTLQGVLFFYGYGFGYFNLLSRSELLVVILCGWAVQLLVVYWYSMYFKQGPLEYVWRKLTYRAAKTTP
ncbi:DUF418 domain-containing protein [Marinoscillum pacificum]|uniref:DUF418 domain-containing protein n=1 Tax=Marinoscillum pacificum TaxID=392723 RepID=UPI00215779D9|nr:DUF418 domain-containing protein [Marinoscillum pacificum]